VFRETYSPVGHLVKLVGLASGGINTARFAVVAATKKDLSRIAATVLLSTIKPGRMYRFYTID
jgi:hypothetical protein